MGDPVIIGGARTPIGRLLGSLAGFSAAELGGFAIADALRRSGVGPADVEYVIMGHVLQAGTGQITSRQAAVKAGIPMSVPATTVNKVCLSGLDAIAQAADLIRLGEYDVVVAGGMESMTNAPHLLANSRKGYKYGAVEMIDAMAYDGLTDAFDGLSMGESTERHNAKFGITREEQDEFSARSQQRAAQAADSGVLGEEIVAVEVPQRGKPPAIFAADEGIRPGSTAQSLGKLPPAFGAGGTITAGSSSQISDGAAAVVVTSREKAEQLGVAILAEVGAFGTVGGPGQLAARPARQRDQARAGEGRQAARRPRPHRDQRGVRRRRHPLHARAWRRRGQGQRQRGRDRARSPAGRLRHPHRADPDLRTAPPRRRPRRAACAGVAARAEL